MNRIPRPALVPALALVLSACASVPSTPGATRMFVETRETVHRAGDDLLTAGLGLSGLRAMAPPAFADAARPTPGELRRRALWANWRGIADLAPGGGYGELYGSTASVPGREFSAFARVPGASQPHRVLAQVPDAFDAGRRCLLVTASSGSRGIYGAIAVAGAWGLPRGCAVAYTDKGAGTDYFDLESGAGFDASGQVAPAGRTLAFQPAPATGAGIAFKHAHSRDNPEADWGRHVRQAADFGLQALDAAFPAQAPFTHANTRVIAVGLSNGGGAVLRAAEDAEPWLDAVVAAEPNVLASGHGARALYDYATEAALLMPCANIGLRLPPVPGGIERCTELGAQGVLADARNGYGIPAAHALDILRKAGWTDAALRAGQISLAFDLWRGVAAGYASAYGRYPHDAHPCGYRYAGAVDGTPAALPAWAHAALWADASGIPPGAPIQLFNPGLAADPLPGLQCLRALWTGDGEDARRVRAGIEQTRARAPRTGLPVVVVHGTDDGLVPPAFSSAPYVAMANAAGRDVRYWQVRNVQHFDAFLGLPAYASSYLPLLPYVYAALDRVDAHLDGKAALPASAVIATTPRNGDPLDAAHLAMPD